MQSSSASPSSSAHDVGDGSAGDATNLIAQSALVDIAFLHSIATHRPIGPHKHFNMIPILLGLDRTVRQVGARIRDDSFRVDLSAGSDGGGEIKREEEADNDGVAGDHPAAPVPQIDSQMIWQRLEELYDVGGLEELVSAGCVDCGGGTMYVVLIAKSAPARQEYQAVDNDTFSPFSNTPLLHRRRLTPAQAALAPFGFGSGLAKKRKQVKAPRVSTKRGAANADDDEAAVAAGEQKIEFELGPWDEFEELIAPRRLKSYEGGDEGQSDSDGELSEPSEAEAEEEPGQHQDDAEDEDVSASDEGEGGDEEGDDDDEDDEDGDESTTKQKMTKRGYASKRSKQTAAPTPSSRGTRNSTKPRRSARR